MRKDKITGSIDLLTILIYLVLVTLGWLNIYSADYSDQYPNILDMDQRYGKQFLWIIAALVIATTIIVIDYRFFEFFGYVIYIAAILLLLFVLVAGKEINGAKSWFSIGSFQIQPSEFAKPAVALALAKYLSTFNINIHKLSTFVITALIIFAPSMLILMQPDTGSALVFFAFILTIYREGFSSYILLIGLGLVILSIMVLLFSEIIVLAIILAAAFIVYWFITQSFRKAIKILLYFLGIYGFVFALSHLSGTPGSFYLAGVIATIIGALIAAIVIYIKNIRRVIYVVITVVASIFFSYTVSHAFHNYLSGYQQNRINIMLGIDSDLLGAGYNLNQSKIAIGSGGLTGKGFLNGTQTKMHFVPEQSTDFIFCTVGEELGFIGTTFIIILFIVLLYRLIFLAERQRSRFARIYGYGVIAVLFFHFAINIAMTIGLFPVVGIPLPFFSYGGSSLWAFTILLFIFIRFDASRTDYLA